MGGPTGGSQTPSFCPAQYAVLSIAHLNGDIWLAVLTYNNGLFGEAHADQAEQPARTAFATSSSLYVPLSARGPAPVTARRLSRLGTPRASSADL